MTAFSDVEVEIKSRVHQVLQECVNDSQPESSYSDEFDLVVSADDVPEFYDSVCAVVEKAFLASEGGQKAVILKQPAAGVELLLWGLEASDGVVSRAELMQCESRSPALVSDEVGPSVQDHEPEERSSMHEVDYAEVANRIADDMKQLGSRLEEAFRRVESKVDRIQRSVEERGDKSRRKSAKSSLKKEGGKARRKTDSLAKKFSRNLKALRVHRNLTQRELAERAGLHSPNVAAFESGTRRPTFPVIERLAEALEVAPEKLLAEGGG